MTALSHERHSIMVNQTDLTFRHPFTALIAGPTGSGKTVLLRRLLECHQNTFSGLPNTNVLWAYGVWQPLYGEQVPGVKVTYVEGLPTQDDIANINPAIIVLDDLMSELGGNKAVANLFTRGSHHQNLSVFFIVQNVFHQAPQMRNISLNSHYIILTKNTRDKSQIITLARQLYPRNTNHLLEAYNHATSFKFGYLVLDLKPDTPEKFRMRTRLCSHETPDYINGGFGPIVYIPKE